MSKIPLLIISDAPSSSSGLGRICRELAVRINENLSDVFSIGTLGIGGQHSRNFGFPNYPVMRIQEMVIHDLPSVMKDFVGDSKERPVILTILNASWQRWLADPTHPIAHVPLREYLHSGRDGTRPFDLWMYVPIDGHTPTGRLPADSIAALKGADRVLAYTRYGASVVDRSLAAPEADSFGPSLKQMAQSSYAPTEHLPHGIDRTVFYPRDRTAARRHFLARIQGKTQPADLAAALPLRDTMTLLGCVATNSARKDWGLAFDTCAALLARGVNVFFWGHTNMPNGHWSLPAYAKETGMENRTVLTCEPISEDNLAWAYSACDCTLGIGSGGGFEYPLYESLAAGCPTIHGRYAGGAEFLPDEMLVEPVAYRVEQQSMILRPLFKAEDWATAVQANLGKQATLPDELDWQPLWPRFEQWLKAGLGEQR